MKLDTRLVLPRRVPSVLRHYARSPRILQARRQLESFPPTELPSKPVSARISPSSSRSLRVDDFIADGVPDQAGRRLDLQLAVDGCPVNIDRLDAEIEDGCDPLVGLALRYQL
jgi:hypothetical protein